MSGLGWQDLVVALLAAGALAWLVRRRLKRKSVGCENCVRNLESGPLAGGGELLGIERPEAEKRAD